MARNNSARLLILPVLLGYFALAGMAQVSAPAPAPRPPASSRRPSQQKVPANRRQTASADAVGPQIQHRDANVFILFDTSDYMYRDFALAQDSMADFVRSLGPADLVAFYSYSRNLSRRVSLTGDRAQLLRGVRDVSAGDDDALFNSMLLTLQDAGKSKGRRYMVVFSHGPDNASTVTPGEVSEVAQSLGVPIYMVSTGKAKLDALSKSVFERLGASTGGQAYFAENAAEEQKAFAAIRDDLAHLYTLSYYPQFNPNRGWRNIKVNLLGASMRSLNIRARDGYRPLPSLPVEDSLESPMDAEVRAELAALSVIRVNVEMVQMDVAVTDKKGAYVTGLGPQNFQIMEDNIPQQLAIFESGNGDQQGPAPGVAQQDSVKDTDLR